MNVKDYPLWTALITPMNSDGSVDYDSLKNLIKEQEDAGNGLLLLGSTGESLNIDYEERTAILDFALNLKPEVPVMVGVGGINFKETCKWVSYLEGLKGIDAYLMVTPLYAKPGATGQYEWFKGLLDIATRPTMLYNIPGRTGAPLSLEALKRLEGHKNFWAVKEASGSVEQFAKFKEAAPTAMIYSGDDGMLPAFVPCGAEGLVSVAANVWPQETNRYVKLALSNELQEKQLWEECSDALFEASNPIPVKCLMHKLGRISQPNLRAPLTHSDLASVDGVLKANEQVTNWFKGQK